MHPHIRLETGTDFDLFKALLCVLIPSHWLSDDLDDDLDVCVMRYLTEEMAAERISRNIPALPQFLASTTVANKPFHASHTTEYIQWGEGKL